MRARSLLWTVVVAAAAVAVVVWQVRRPGGSGAAPGPGAARASSPRVGRSTLAGVVRRDGQPVGARVELRWSMHADPSLFLRGGDGGFFGRLLATPLADEPPDAVARAGADGRFEVTSLAPGLYDVWVVAGDGSQARVAASVSVDGARVELPVAVAPATAALRGRVVGRGGRPFVGLVTVDPAPTADGDASLLSVPFGAPAVRTDAEGRFTAEGLVAGTYRVSALVPGASRAVSRPVPVPFEGDFVLVAGPEGGEVDGRATADDDGSPVAGAEVFGCGKGGALDASVVRAVSGADGRFRVVVPSAIQRLVVAFAPGCAAWMGSLAEVGIRETFAVRMMRNARVEGRVVSAADGKPVVGVRVTPMAAQRPPTYDAPWAVTGPDGRYVIESALAGDAHFQVSGDGWLTEGALASRDAGLDPVAPTLRPGATTTVDLRAVRGGRVRGRVLSAAGLPVVGAVVRAEVSGQLRSAAVRVPTTVTDADGAFGLDGIYPDHPYAIVVLSPVGAEHRVGPVRAAVDETSTLDVTLPEPRFVDALVLDAATGRPIAGAHVAATVPGSSGGRVSRTSLCGPDGTTRAGPFPAGSVTLRVGAEGYVETEPFDLGKDERRIERRLARGADVGGRVLDERGAPASDLLVWIVPEGGPVTRRAPETTDADGRFRFRGLALGRYVVSVTRRRADEPEARAERAVAAGDDVTLTLAREAELAAALVVRAAGPDGERVAVARVRVFEEAGPSWEGVMRDGVATVDRPARGLRVVQVSEPRSVSGAPLPWGPARVARVAPGERECVVRLPRERTLAGTVRGPDGAPVADVEVLAVLDGEDLERGLEHAVRARSGADGGFRLAGQGDVDVLLLCRVPDAYLEPAPVRVRAGTSDVAVALRAAAQAVVHVVGPDGAPVADVSVLARPTDGDAEAAPRVRSARTDATGLATLRGLDPARTATLEVVPGDAPFFAASRVGWVPAETTMRLDAARRLTGVVRDAAGRPLPAPVSFQSGAWLGGAIAGPDGRFVLRVPATGDVVVCARAPGAAPTDRAPEGAACRTVRAEEKDVELVVDVGAELVVRLEDPSGATLPRFVLARVTGPGGASSVRAATVERGRATFPGLGAGDRVALLVPGEGRDRTAVVRDVAPRGEVVVRLTDGLRLAGRADAPADATEVRVSAWCEEFDATVDGVRDEQGRFEVRGLPEGTTWRVVVLATGGGRTAVERSDPVAPGATDLHVVVASPSR